MGKRAKFPLNMGKKDDTNEDIMVRDIKELHDNYNADKVTEYFINGKLLTWLEDRYYDEEAEKVRELSEMPDKQKAAEKLPGVFDVKIKKEVNVEAIEIHNEKLKKLREITSDDEILANVDYVAFSQEDLSNLLCDDANVIYLCGEYFCVPLNMKNVKYIGINNPIVDITRNDNASIDFEDNGIVFENCEFSEKTKDSLNINSIFRSFFPNTENKDEEITTNQSADQLNSYEVGKAVGGAIGGTIGAALGISLEKAGWRDWLGNGKRS